MNLQHIIAELEAFAPLAFQEDYDNCGLLTGKLNLDVTGVLLSLDCTEEVIEEALASNCNLVIAHHPVIFSGLKKLNGNTVVERVIIKAIKHDIAIYACHTNIDNVQNGVNQKISEKLQLKNQRILAPKGGLLKKLVTYVPSSHHQAVLDKLFASGAGKIGNYDSCSFNTEGTGTYRGNALSNPFKGKANQLSKEPEIRVETVFEAQHENNLIKGLLSVHPYEEVAFDVFPLANNHPQVGSGMIGELEEPLGETEFMTFVKTVFKVPTIKHTRLSGKTVHKIAVCGGSGRFLLKSAIRAGAEVFITADFKYHDYFEVDNKLLLLDIGHFESEQFTPEIFYDIIQKKFPTFAIHLSKINTNPINYF